MSSPIPLSPSRHPHVEASEQLRLFRTVPWAAFSWFRWKSEAQREKELFNPCWGVLEEWRDDEWAPPRAWTHTHAYTHLRLYSTLASFAATS